MAKKLTREEFIKKAKEIHRNEYDYSKVIYYNSRSKVIIICPKHGEFLQIPNGHLNGNKCKHCRKLSKKIFINRAIEVHGNRYDYSKVNYINTKEKVIIICPKHGEFLQSPESHFNGQGCKKCSIIKLGLKKFIEYSKQIHGNKYIYSEVNYINSKEKVVIICPKHGKFLQRPNNHLNGQGCKKCNIESKKLTLKNFINRSRKIHKDKYDYSKVNYINNQTKVIIICPKHGEFLQTPNHHLNGLGCKNCAISISKPSQKWLDRLKININNREKIIKVNNRKFIVDGYNPKTNTVYEFYGDFWHGNPKIYNENDINPIVKKTHGELYNRTIERENILKSAGYNLITIWESDWKKE